MLTLSRYFKVNMPRGNGGQDFMLVEGGWGELFPAGGKDKGLSAV